MDGMRPSRPVRSDSQHRERGPRRTAAQNRARGAGRLPAAVAWLATVSCLPYLTLKVLWTVGMPAGISDRSLVDETGWAAANALMAVVQVAALLLVVALTRPWSRRLPTWFLLFPVWVGTGLLFQVVVGATLAGVLAPASQDAGGSTGGIDLWVFVLVYAGFAGQGVALAIAFTYFVRTHWSQLLRRSTADVLASRTARFGAWPERHLARIAEALAGAAVAVAVLFTYWAAGGSFGLSASQPHPSEALQASRVLGAVVAVAGLLAVAGRWGRQRRFWLPAALTWVGSGALTGFDGFTLVLNRIVTIGTDTAASGWSLIDTALLIKMLIGVLAAAVGIVAVRGGRERTARLVAGLEA